MKPWDKLTRKQKELLAYAVVFLINSFDDQIEEDLGLTEQELRDEAVKTGIVKRE